MAAFATMASAEARALVLMGSNLATSGIVEAHSGRTKDGTICVRVLRSMSLATTLVADGQLQSKAGAWEELTSDTDT